MVMVVVERETARAEREGELEIGEAEEGLKGCGGEEREEGIKKNIKKKKLRKNIKRKLKLNNQKSIFLIKIPPRASFSGLYDTGALFNTLKWPELFLIPSWQHPLNFNTNLAFRPCTLVI